MATKFPVILNGVRFLVNPVGLSIKKNLQYGTLGVQAGVKYQFWYHQPEMLTISGYSAGKTAFQELLFLRQNYDITINPGKLSQLFYKSQTYTGFLTSMEVSDVITQGNHLVFRYTLPFQLLSGQVFKVEDFATQPTGLLGQATNIFSQTVNQPIAGLQNNIDRLLGKING